MNARNLRLCLTLGATVMATVSAGAPPSPVSTADTALERPHDLRDLVFLTSGRGMAYGPAADRAKQAGGGSPPFTNVFVSPEAYRAFMQSGKWPEGTTFFLEVRAGIAPGANGTRGNSQGEIIAIEGEKKDSSLYPNGGFAYFDFGDHGSDARAKPLPATASCYACHRQHGAVEWTFTQFYPDQFAVAKKMDTVRKDYDPDIR